MNRISLYFLLEGKMNIHFQKRLSICQQQDGRRLGALRPSWDPGGCSSLPVLEWGPGSDGAGDALESSVLHLLQSPDEHETPGAACSEVTAAGGTLPSPGRGNGGHLGFVSEGDAARATNWNSGAVFASVDHAAHSCNRHFQAPNLLCAGRAQCIRSNHVKLQFYREETGILAIS